MCAIWGYYSINFFPIWTKICLRTALEVPSNIVHHVRPAPGISKKVMDHQIWKRQKLRNNGHFERNFGQHKILQSKNATGKSSYNLSRRLCAKFEPNRMASFWDRLRSGQILWEVNRTTATRGPYPSGKDFAEKKISGHLAATALGSMFWCTSSKGMPRHAHGRGALV